MSLEVLAYNLARVMRIMGVREYGGKISGGVSLALLPNPVPKNRLEAN